MQDVWRCLPEDIKQNRSQQEIMSLPPGDPMTDRVIKFVCEAIEEKLVKYSGCCGGCFDLEDFDRLEKKDWDPLYIDIAWWYASNASRNHDSPERWIHYDRHQPHLVWSDDPSIQKAREGYDAYCEKFDKCMRKIKNTGCTEGTELSSLTKCGRELHKKQYEKKQRLIESERQKQLAPEIEALKFIYDSGQYTEIPSWEALYYTRFIKLPRLNRYFVLKTIQRSPTMLGNTDAKIGA